MSTPSRRLVLPALIFLAATGCNTCQKKKGCSTCPPPPPPGSQIIAPAPMTGLPPGGTLLPPAPPPPGVPAAPPPTFPSGAGYPPVASFYPAPSDRPSVPKAVAEAPAAPKAEAPAAPSAAASATPEIRLLPPEFGSSTATPPVTAPATNDQQAATPSLPVGIADFAPAIADRVAGGRKPALEGLDWLKANGYKSAVQLRRPGESDAADRKQFEARGLTFQSLEVSPATLSWATVDTFAKLVSDSTMQPLFVYDTDGSLSGGLWYLYFRRVERLTDESARLRAARLGLREATDGPQREMWLAVQKLLAQGA